VVTARVPARRLQEQRVAPHPAIHPLRHLPCEVTDAARAQLPRWQQRGVYCGDLIDELMAADVIVAGVPMYNFAPPAHFKAHIDNIVRVGQTFGFDRSRDGEPYWPLLADQNKRLVLCARGDSGYATGDRLGHMNHVEASIRTAVAYIGITRVGTVAVEYDEFSDERLPDPSPRRRSRLTSWRRGCQPNFPVERIARASTRSGINLTRPRFVSCARGGAEQPLH
jgi:FMN-dependent NADH-azoreductase